MDRVARHLWRALLDLALFYDRGPVNLQNICQRQNISADYLEQILRRLRNAGLVRSVRGPKGGFMLAKPPYGKSWKWNLEGMGGKDGMRDLHFKAMGLQSMRGGLAKT